MCGITGVFSFNGNQNLDDIPLEESLRAIQHRGPDFQDSSRLKNAALGHARLAIIDPSERANQPMTDSASRYTIVYNGVCYNHLELRERLASKNINYKSESDTETVLYWILEKGSAGLKDINGFFSLAIYDKLDRKLLLARDRFGIKPLYYRTSEQSLTFSSELNGLKRYNGEGRLNHNALSAYLHLNYIPSPHGIEHEYKKLLPGTYLMVNYSGKIEMHRYFSPHFGIRKDKDKVQDMIASQLEEAVRKRLMSDVPLGCFLSGGLDSSIITGLASKHVDKLKTFTLVFKGNRQYDESKDAQLVARHFKTEHHELEIREEELIESVNHLLDHVDEPFADSSAIAMFNLCKKTSESVKVALSGDGGDELFAGYRKHLALYNAHKFPLLNGFVSLGSPLINVLPKSREKGIYDAARKWERFTSAASLPANERYWKWAGYGNPVPDLFQNASFDFNSFMDEVYLTEIENFDDCLKMDLAMVLEGDMLVKTDRMSMLNGLEVRVPFLDHEFVELINRLPAKKKIGLLRKKKLLKSTFKNLLPNEILNKAKHGFEVPLKSWLNNELDHRVEELLDPDLIADQGLFDVSKVKELNEMRKLASSNNSEYTIWALMVFNSWWKKNR